MTNRLLTRLDLRQAHAFYDRQWWQDETIYTRARRNAADRLEQPAFVESGRTVTYRALFEAADRFAQRLYDAGLRAGDRVAVWLPARIEVAIAVLACSRNGYVVCPSLHRDHTVADVAELIERMGARAFLGLRGHGADADRRDIADHLEGQAGLVLTVDLADDHEDLLASEPTGQGSLPSPADDPEAVVYLAFTSGTTGAPKGVMHSSNTVLAPVRQLVTDWSLGAGSVIYSLSPLSHNLGFGAMVLAVTTGGTLVSHDLARGASVAERLAQTGANFIFGVPTHAIDLLAELEAGTVDRLEELRGFRISGAAIPAEVARRLIAAGITPQSGYGMTEAGSHHYTLPHDPPELVVASSGRPCDGHEVRIVSSDDPTRDLVAGEVGQILGRGPSVMLGYFDDQRETEAAFTPDGWLQTGDLGWMDEDGYLRITGRKKDVIIRGGHNIFPARIENLASQHRDVARAVAIPIPDERLGERVCLVITLTGADAPDPGELLAFLDAEGLSKYDMPEYFAVVDAIPLLPSGKVDKRRVQQQYEESEFDIRSIRFTGPK